jgi:hypothetical protein
MAMEPDDIASRLAAVTRVAADADRPDLVRRLRIAATRLNRATTVASVVGEFKQGKSSLVNGLVAADVCPVDDDLGTSALTVVHHQSPPAIVAKRRVDGERRSETIRPAVLRDHVTEAGNPGNERSLERVEIGIDAPLLRDGLVLVDTPGLGGIHAGLGAATLAFLPFADALVLVTDASAELSVTELDLLGQAAGVCPTVLVALTKIDLYPDWRRIADLDRRHLATAGLDITVYPVSVSLRFEALAGDDPVLGIDSGFPALLEAIETQVVRAAHDGNRRRATADADAAVRDLIDVATMELATLADGERATRAGHGLEQARERLARLRGPGTQWPTVINDGIASLSADVHHQFRARLRMVNQAADEAIDGAGTAAAWDGVGRRARSDAAAAVTAAFTAIDEGAAGIERRVAALLAEADLGLERAAAEIPEIAGDPVAPADGPRPVRRLLTHLLAAGGGTSTGLILLGILGSVLPAGAAAALAATPLAIGAAVVFGGQRVSESRQREVSMQRQAAKQAVRRFLDDLQFEVTDQVSDTLRQVHQRLRDGTASWVADRQAAVSATIRRLEDDLQRDEAGRTARVAELEMQLATLRSLMAEIGART